MIYLPFLEIGQLATLLQVIFDPEKAPPCSQAVGSR